MVTDVEWQSIIQYQQSRRGKDFKGFLAQPRLHIIVSKGFEVF